MNGLAFDPGFEPHILAFRGTIEYLYADINKFKNLSQKKIRFRQYYKKILNIFYNNIGFYSGCLLWAEYLSLQPAQKIISNPCLGETYDEESNINEIEYITKFAELFPRDMKYFLGNEFSFNPKEMKILDLYKEFLIINKGFTETKLSTDVLLPTNLNKQDPKKSKEKIDEAIKSGKLEILFDFIEV